MYCLRKHIAVLLLNCFIFISLAGPAVIAYPGYNDGSDEMETVLTGPRTVAEPEPADDDEELPAKSYQTPQTESGEPKTVDLGVRNVSSWTLHKEVPEGKNWCGQYATYVILKQHFGKDIKFKDLYEEVNPAGIFSAPDALVRYARDQGIPAAKHNNASLDDLRAQLDKGNPVTILGTGPDGKTPHYIAVTGYQTDAAGNIVSLQVADSCYMREIPVDEFKQMWANPLDGMNSALGTMSGYRNLMITYDGSRSFNFETSFDDSVANGITNIVAGWKKGSVSQMLRAVPQLGRALIGAVPVAVGRGIDWVGSKAYNWGKRKWSEGGFFGKVAGGAAVVAGGATKVAGKVVSGVGNAVSAVGNWIGNLW